MQPVDLLSILPASTHRLLAAARATGPDATVPTCPGWRTWDLVAHTAGTFRFVAASIRANERVSKKTLPPSPPGEAAFDDLDAAMRDVRATIEAVGMDGQAWNWSDGPQVGAFWARRMAHEATIHMVDAAVAAGHEVEVDRAVAADGIDELLTVIVPLVVRSGRAEGIGGLGRLHVHCTDTEGEWLVEPSETSFAVRREHAKGDAALRGVAADLLLRLYNRGDGGEVIGDAGVLERWRERVRF